MSKERLKKVEEIVNVITTTESEEEYNSAVNAFILSHMNWTLKRIKELEKERSEWKGKYSILKNKYRALQRKMENRWRYNRALENESRTNEIVLEEFREEIKRYREAIEDIKNVWKVTDTHQEYMDTVHDIIKVLEGEE